MRSSFKANLFQLFAVVWMPNEPFRFDPNDAESIDSEQRLGSEYYNDELSYEFTERSEREWSESLSGYRTSAGSLNMREFSFNEDIRLQTKREEDFRFGFTSVHRQNLLDDAVDREIRMDARLFSSSWLMSIVADGDGTKSFADFGVGLLRESETISFGIDLWSVDHFYNTKTLTDPDRYQTKPRAGRAHVQWQWQTWTGLLSVAEQTKVDWMRSTVDQQYAFVGRYVLHESRVKIGDMDEVRIQLRQEMKNESAKELLGDAPFEKSLERRQREIDVSWVRAEESKSNTRMGLRSWQRTATYDYSGSSPNSSDDLPEASVDRREWAAYATRYNYSESGSGWQWGLFWNHLPEWGDDDLVVNEVKLQTAFDWRLNPKANMFWNITWDLDKAVRRFPYDDDEFQPWGGGNLQVNVLL